MKTQFFQDTVESQLSFIDKCVTGRVVYYDNKPENQCKNKNGDLLIIDTDVNFFETEQRILDLPDFLSKYAKVVMLVIYLLVFMVNLDIFDKKYQKNQSDIKYYQQFIIYIKQGKIPSINSILISETIIFLYNNKIVEAIRIIKHYLKQYVPMDKYKELDTENGLINWLLATFHLQAPSSTQVRTSSSKRTPMASSTQVRTSLSKRTPMPVSMKMPLPPHPYIKLPSHTDPYMQVYSQPRLLKSSLININHAISNPQNSTKRTMDSIALRKQSKQNAQNEKRKIENSIEKNPNNIEIKYDMNWLYDVWGEWYIPDNTPKEPLSSIWRIINRGAGSRRPKKMNSRKKHLNKRTHKSINARTSKSNPK